MLPNQFVQTTKTPELVFGLVGAIGVDMELVQNQVCDALTMVGYAPVNIRVTELMKEISTSVELDTSDDPLAHYESRIAYANAVRAKCGNDAALAALAIHRIRQHRKSVREGSSDASPDDRDRPVEKTAYVIRQFKRAEEIHLLRTVYGRKFIQISVHVTAEDRKRALSKKMVFSNSSIDPGRCDELAQKLIDRDLDEVAKEHGQRIGEVFHLGDVFVNGKTENTVSDTVNRFISALFGKNNISPRKDEYGAYTAAAASLRSLDTSRQVGAAIFSDDGEIISQGCNEVPRAGGGLYWSDDESIHRDFEEGGDANRAQRRRITYDFLNRLFESKLLNSDKFDSAVFNEISDKPAIKDALIADITEFGRMAHAEMTAITDAARLGRSTCGATLFCTTFPCHNCAKHIIACGIKRVVFIEPYPKSQAAALHSDAITIDDEREGKIIFEHFVGISPRRYRDIFEKGNRRSKSGKVQTWYEGHPAPRIEDRGPSYVYNEASAAYYALSNVADELGIQQPSK